jgi:16S rRNA processing protein RimM
LGDDRYIVLGRVSGVYGVKGWLKIYSETDPVQNIVRYKPWFIEKDKQWSVYVPLQGRKHGKGVVAQLEGCDDRDVAATFKGCKIAIRREQLPRIAGLDEYYWTDLEGLKVKNLDGIELGIVSHLFETGSNDVVVVKGDRERLVPYIKDQVILKIDLDDGIMVVDWDPEF